MKARRKHTAAPEVQRARLSPASVARPRAASQSARPGGPPLEPSAVTVALLAVEDLKRALRSIIVEELAVVKDWIGDGFADTSKHLTVDEAASELRCSVYTVRRYISSGRLAALRTGHGGTGRVLIPRRALDDLIAASRS